MKSKSHLEMYPEFGAMPTVLQAWVTSSDTAAALFDSFFAEGGVITANKEIRLGTYVAKNPPEIEVNEKLWMGMLLGDGNPYPQRHMLGMLAHEIGHHEYNPVVKTFMGSQPDQYVAYRSELEGRAIFTAFRIFKELEQEPILKNNLPFDSIGYLQGMELGQLYNQWNAGQLTDEAVVGLVAQKIASTPYTLQDSGHQVGSALTDQDGDGRLTHRDLYLRDFQRIPRFHPQPDAPAVEPSAAVQPAAIPLLDNPTHPGHALYAQALQGMQANPRFPDGPNQQQLAANLVAAIATLPEGRVSDGLLQEKLSRIDTVTLSSDGTALMAIDGKPDANLRLRYGMPLEQAQSASFEAASQQAYDALSRQRIDEQALAAQREREQPRDSNPPGPVVG